MDESWTVSTEHPGYRCKTLQFGQATVTVFRPILDDEERTKRENHLRAVAERVLRDYTESRQQDEHNHH